MKMRHERRTRHTIFDQSDSTTQKQSFCKGYGQHPPSPPNLVAMVHKIESPSEPPVTLSSPADLLSGYLDFYRDAVLRKLEGMSDAELRHSRLPSGWVP